MAVSDSTNLSVTVAQAIAFLIRPLVATYPATTLVKLQLVLEANLIAHFAPTWVPNEPLRGSGRRCLTLSPNSLPPRIVYAACLAAGIQWFEWMAALGGREFDFLVDPGCISVRFSGDAKLITIWSEELAIEAAMSQLTMQNSRAQQSKYSKTLAQQLLEGDQEDDDELFAMIADEVSAPTWLTPVHDQFPEPVRSGSPLSVMSAHSRSSSRSSNSSSGFSLASSFTTYDSYRSASSMSGSSSRSAGADGCVHGGASRRERARQARVYIDTSKTEVTPYDGGKTTVLTGGVMLGAAPSTRPKKVTPSQANWRRV